MGSICGEERMELDSQDSSAHGEKIFVSIRLRPLNEREISRNDVSDWECINSTTIVFKNTLQERSMLPTAYTFDRVFGSEAATREVYEEAAKKITLSVLSGINSTIFAYGQTSSGKTYTMTGITEYAIADIYEYIDQHPEREFVLKFSAIEIYNESVRDLLSTDGTPLRLLDDPERGTVVDKLSEIALRDSAHLKELLSICEAQRQNGETILNEMSSRSHQILRLTVDSEAREFCGADNASILTASVNFVDLAGSERASQTLSAGTRLKEGCHINRSLLTLGTVIRKLSKGRNAHIPYRDSKLTRILHSSLGGNARTAIICTMSPAHSHLEQSRNTLLFASCAKQVGTNAQVNIVMSEKALVKQLQKELARLQNELRGLRSLAISSDSTSSLKEKEQLIGKMDKEIKELTHQRDIAQSRIEDMLRSGLELQSPKSWVMSTQDQAWTDDYPASEASEIIDPLPLPPRSDVAHNTSNLADRSESANFSRITDQFTENGEEQFLSDDTSPRLYIDKYFGPDPCKGWEKIAPETDKNSEYSCKEVQCIEIDFTKTNRTSSASYQQKEDHSSGRTPDLSDEEMSDSGVNVTRSRSCAAVMTTVRNSLSPEEPKENENVSKHHPDYKGVLSVVEPPANNGDLYKDDSRNTERRDFLSDKEQTFKRLDKDLMDKQQVASATELNEVQTPKLLKQIKHELDLQDEETYNISKRTSNASIQAENIKHSYDVSNESENIKQSTDDWPTKFEKQQREIIELWDACNVPLFHRTYFFLLFRGDPSDAVYMEVELRRLSFLKDMLHGARVVKDGQQFTRASSAKALNREREILSKQMLKKYSRKEREALYHKSGVDIKSKQRRFQVCRRLWTDTSNMEHIKESAHIVARLVGFKEQAQAPKEMLGLSFTPKPAKLRSFSWRHGLSSPLV